MFGPPPSHQQQQPQRAAPGPARGSRGNGSRLHFNDLSDVPLWEGPPAPRWARHDVDVAGRVGSAAGGAGPLADETGLFGDSSLEGGDGRIKAVGAGVSGRDAALRVLPKPSRLAALRARHRLQVRQYDKDAFGVQLPASARPFSLLASPLAVAEACRGLGVYLASLKAMVIVALLLSVCAAYPLVNNLKTQRWARDYALVVDGVSHGAVLVSLCFSPPPFH
jgi:hypothetical protein